ncbi:SDR family oxidoreductase [Wenxinia marina]|uniref:Dehydrogenase n=1 Tax=Wenxinia marina DSM 24838 TaxID=1123501 RepID=A0A0D0PGI0_9RHOB|nr:SDR family oxidoreductase [Wenxinia marina]KIQ70461.1 Dehydrogenase [Wenxinia marina DSM 24838]GGL52962.1 oxidoreductase [Wenxinia marina]
MDGKRAIITGAGGGIGGALAEDMTARGWQVLGLDLNADGLGRLQGGAMTRVCDVTDEDAVAEAVAATGWDGLDLLVSNAGIARPYNTPIEQLTLAEWRRLTDSHLLGAFLLVRACAPLLRARRGSIVLMSSVRALQSEPDSEAYATAKAGLTGMAHALAMSLGPEVRTNAVAPGWISHDPDGVRDIDNTQHPVGRVGRFDDIVGTVRWLTEAEFVTGQTIVVDGGMGRKMIYEE